MRKYLFLALICAACVPAKPRTWYKPGEGRESFEQTKAECMFRVRQTTTFSSNMFIAMDESQEMFDLCMRGQGWYVVSQ